MSGPWTEPNWVPHEMEIEDIMEGAACQIQPPEPEPPVEHSEKQRKELENLQIMRSLADSDPSNVAPNGRAPSPPNIVQMSIREQLRLSGIRASGFIRGPGDEGPSNGHANGDSDGDPTSIRSFQPKKMFNSVLGKCPPENLDDNSDDPDNSEDNREKD